MSLTEKEQKYLAIYILSRIDDEQNCPKNYIEVKQTLFDKVRLVNGSIEEQFEIFQNVIGNIEVDVDGDILSHPENLSEIYTIEDLFEDIGEYKNVLERINDKTREKYYEELRQFFDGETHFYTAEAMYRV